MAELDRPVLAALRTRQASHAVSNGLALRYAEDVSPFAATAVDSDASLDALADLIPTGKPIVLLQAGACFQPQGTVVELSAQGVQMTVDRLITPRGRADFEELAERDAPEMQALAALTKPGPFLPRTHQLGIFIGIRKNGRLVAMAGERMKLPGFTEISGVCTHPEFRGNGFASLLSHAVAERILERGETPFLHAFAHNNAAIHVYKSLGFLTRCAVSVMILRRDLAAELPQ